MITRSCLFCLKELVSRYQKKYCSVQCQKDDQRRQFIQQWRGGTRNAAVGRRTRGLSQHVRTFLLEKNGEKCSSCGWNQRNPKTNKVPLEVDHIDGNADNNTESNLRLLCPNCHSLTPHFRNLNKGHGRAWRLQKERPRPQGHKV